MTLASPLALIGLLLLVVVLVADQLRPWNVPLWRRALATATRASMLALLVLALARPSLRGPAGDPVLVVVVDRSLSIDDARLDAAVKQAMSLGRSTQGMAPALVLADADARVVIPPGSPWLDAPVERGPRPEASDLGQAVQVALGLIDPAAGGRVVLISDGGDTTGGVAAAGLAAAHAGVAVDGLTVPPRASDPAITALELDAPVVRPGETASGTVILRGPAGGAIGWLTVEVDGRTVLGKELELTDERATRVVFEVDIAADASPGARVVRAQIRPEGVVNDPGNDIATAGLAVGLPPKVLLVSLEPAELAGVSAALSAESMSTVSVAPSALDETSLDDVDLVFLGDVPAAGRADGLPAVFVDRLRRWTAAGGGLVTLGGDRTYELGGWGSTPLADLVPLELAPEGEDVEPAVAMLQVLDNSASMGDWTGYQTKMALANEAAVASMRLLRPKDWLGVAAVNTEVHWVVPAQPVTDPLRLGAALRGIKPGGGGIYTYTALIAAESALRGVDTPVQHVVLYADAQDAEEMTAGRPFGFGAGPNAYQVAQRLKQGGATLSVIALGDPRDQDVGALRKLADLGGGRFRITGDPRELRALFVEETRQIVNSVVHDTPFQVRLDVPHPIVAGLDWERAPPLLGYVEVSPRDTATTVLTGPGGVPVLAAWQYGLGQVVSLSTDLGPRWGTNLLGWWGYNRFVVQLGRHALRPPVARGTALDVQGTDQGMSLIVQRLDDRGLALEDRGLDATFLTDGGDLLDVALRAEAPGRWRGAVQVEAGSAGELVLTEQATGLEVDRQPLLVPQPPERRTVSGDALLQLAAASGGQIDGKTLGAPSAPKGTPVPLWPWLVVLSVLLMAVDAWLRRPVRDATFRPAGSA